MNISDFRQQMACKYNMPSEELNEVFLSMLNIKFADLFSSLSLTGNECKKIEKAIKKYLAGMPINKIFKKAYFYGLEYFINKNVLAPRSDTETLVQSVIGLEPNNESTILDLCTGSGIIAITLAKRCGSTVDAVDISSSAINVAKKNAKIHNANITVIKSNLFGNVKKRYDIIVCNPPYISTEEMKGLDKSVLKYDPALALHGGADGLDFYRKIASQAHLYLCARGRLLFEICCKQAEAVVDILSSNGYVELQVVKDLAGRDRVVIATKGE